MSGRRRSFTSRGSRRGRRAGRGGFRRMNNSNNSNQRGGSPNRDRATGSRGASGGRGGPGPSASADSTVRLYGRGSGPNNPRPSQSPPSAFDSICPICRTQIVNLCITNCNHRFCRDCITRWTSRNATCPSCRQNIHTIRNIMPDGGTEIIQISRAELIAHKINEVHSILMLLFTVMAHTMLPQVTAYMDQLNEIARDLNVPTTSSRLETAVRRAMEANDGNSGTGSTTATGQSTSSTATTPTTTTASQQNRLGGRRRTRLSSNRDTAEDSDDEASTGSSAVPGGGIEISIPAQLPALAFLAMRSMDVGLQASPNTSSANSSPAVSPSSATSTAATTTSTTSPAVSSRPTTSTTTTTSTTGSTVASQTGGVGPLPRLGSATQAAPTATSTVPTSAASNLTVTSATNNPAPTSAAPATVSTSTAPTSTTTPTSTQTIPTSSTSTATTTTSSSVPRIFGPVQSSTVASSSHRPLTRYVPPPERRDMATNTYASSYPANPRITHTYQPANSSDINSRRPSNQFSRSRLQPPTAEEARRNMEQRQKDIRLLTESYHKINQIHEVLTIMHMMVHRNEVQLESPRPNSPADSDSS